MKYITAIIILLTTIGVRAQVVAKERPTKVKLNSVGIGTNNPEATLDVDGNVRVEKLKEYNRENYVLSWSPKNGRLTKATSAPLVFNYKRYKVYMVKSGNEFNPYFKLNTKISAKDYILIISNYHIRSRHNDEAFGENLKENRFGATKSKYNTIPIDKGPGTLGNETPHNRGGGTSAVGIWSSVNKEGNWEIQGNLTWASIVKPEGTPYDNEFYWDIGVMVVPNNYMDRNKTPLTAKHIENPDKPYNYIAEPPLFVKSKDN